MHSYNVVETGQPLQHASRAVILLHGRGGSAQDILSLATHFCDSSFYVAAPQATNNTWYPNSFLQDEKSNEPWLSSAVALVKKLLDSIQEFIPVDHIYLMGFSQGACLALETAARHADKYGGVVAFSGGLIGKTIEESKYSGNFSGTKIFIGDSEHDPHIPVKRCVESQQVLQKLGADVTLKIYPGFTHIISSEEIDWVTKNIMPFNIL